MGAWWWMVGLASNVGLTAAKGAAGVMMNSASLLAEAGHSFSDLLGVRANQPYFPLHFKYHPP